MQAVNLYWSRFEKESDQDLGKWSESEIQLSELHKLSLISHLKLGHKVYLHTHQKIPNVPSGITITDASPAEIEARPIMAACMPDPHILFSVVASTDLGRSALIAA